MKKKPKVKPLDPEQIRQLNAAFRQHLTPQKRTRVKLMLEGIELAGKLAQEFLRAIDEMPKRKRRSQ